MLLQAEKTAFCNQSKLVTKYKAGALTFLWSICQAPAECRTQSHLAHTPMHPSLQMALSSFLTATDLSKGPSHPPSPPPALTTHKAILLLFPMHGLLFFLLQKALRGVRLPGAARLCRCFPVYYGWRALRRSGSSSPPSIPRGVHTRRAKRAPRTSPAAWGFLFSLPFFFFFAFSSFFFSPLPPFPFPKRWQSAK